MNTRVVVYADKTMLTISGIDVKELRPLELEQALGARLQTTVRVIGVTGKSLDVDIYGLEPDAILRDEAGMIKAISTVPGIRAMEVARIASAERAVEVDINTLPTNRFVQCQAERWKQSDE